MTRRAPAAEKINALVGVFIALKGELHTRAEVDDPRVQVALIHAATSIAIATETRDIGILAPGHGIRDYTRVDPGDHFAHPDADLVAEIDAEFR